MMTKNMKNMVAVLTLGLVAFGGSAFGGHVWEFINDSPTDAAYLAGQEVAFRMRLLAANPGGVDDTSANLSIQRRPWQKLPNMENATVASLFLSDPTHAMDILNAEHPLKIGVVVNGQTFGALLADVKVSDDKYGTDFFFRYPVKCGDYALPLRLAADRNGTPINAGKWSSDAPEKSTKYFFYNGPGDTGNEIWKIATALSTDAFVPQMVSQEESMLTYLPRVILPFNGEGDYLRKFNFTLETLELDDKTAKGDDDKDYWRVIRGAAGEPSEPQMRTIDGYGVATNGLTVYAWVAPAGGNDNDPSTWDAWTENDYAVTIPLDGGKRVTQERFQDPDGVERLHNVYMFTLAPGTQTYPFSLKGLHVGQTARVVLSGMPHWNKIGSTGDFISTDYRLKTVYCGEQQPTISVSLDGFDNPAQFPNANHDLRDYTRGERLRVRLDGLEEHPALKVKLAFELGESTDFPTNIIAISEDKEAGFQTKNLLEGFEVTIPENKAEPVNPVYLFVIGATRETAMSPGIGIKPMPDPAFALPIPNTNALHVVIKGMNPVATAVNDTEIVDGLPTVVAEVRENRLRLRVRIEDSFRNLKLLDPVASNDFYTVKINPGWPVDTDDGNLTITNDISGKLLLPSDYYEANNTAYLNFEINPYTSKTNDYTVTFKMLNPEGMESKIYTLVVPVREGYRVTAKAPEGKEISVGQGEPMYELVESDTTTYRLDFMLNDTLGASGRTLYAFLEPANEIASNRTDGVFFTYRPQAGGAAGTGVEIDTQGDGVGSTDIGNGIKLLDGDGPGDGSGLVAKFNVILCTEKAYDPTKRVTIYNGDGALKVLLDNHEPTLRQLVVAETSAIETGVRTNSLGVVYPGGVVGNSAQSGRGLLVYPMTMKDWQDVARDIDAEDRDLMVTRWLVYRVFDDGKLDPWESYYTYGPTGVLEIPSGLTVYDHKETKYRIVAQIQDKDMRALGTAGLFEDEDEPSGWIYRVYKDLPDYEPDWAGDDESNVWGPEFAFEVSVTDKPNVDIFVKDDGEFIVSGYPAFSESKLTPHNNKVYNDDDMKLVVSLAKKYTDKKAEVKVQLTVATDGGDGGAFLELEPLEVSFVGSSLSREISIKDFDATYRDGKQQRGNVHYKVTATVIAPEDAAAMYNPTTCDFYLVNRPPILELGAGSQEFADYVDNDDETYEIAKNDIKEIAWSARDIVADLTNISITATVVGGKVVDEKNVEYTTYTYTASDPAVVATNYEDGAYNVAFKVKFTSSGTNKVTFVAKDKDGDSSEKHFIRFFVPETKTLLLYPSKPTAPSTDSDDVADYFSAAGVGYGRVWARGDTKLSAIDTWIHDWTCSDDGVVKAYARGYLAGEREDAKSEAFVNINGNHDATLKGYSPADAEEAFETLDSFFYRWFAKLVSEGGSGSNWTAYKPVPQVSKDPETAASQTAMSMSFPKKTGQNATVYNDISALAIFSREYLWSDNLGDINGDGVPDSYVMKYQLVSEYEGGADLRNVNFGESDDEGGGKAPYCQDYLPTTGLMSYSKLIPAITEYGNIKDAVAFTPAKKIRGAAEVGAGEDLNDATAAKFPDGVGNQAAISGAKPEQVYENPDTCPTSTLSKVEWLAWSEFKAAHPDATVKSWSPERPTNPTLSDTDGDGITDGFEYYYWYRAHVGYLTTDEEGKEVHRYQTGRKYNPRNPGEGDFISAQQIAAWMDPIVGSTSLTDDHDNDGLPDLLEFEIGTNPFDFDSDGDGLPDGWEVMIGGTNPSDAYTQISICDAMRNFDGDAMAFTTSRLEGDVLPVPFDIAKTYTFALLDANGDTDGIQWYVSETGLPTNVVPGQAGIECTALTLKVNGKVRTYVTTAKPATGSLFTDDKRLAVDLPKDCTWTAVKADDASLEQFGLGIADDYVRLMPTHLSAGTPLVSWQKEIEIEVEEGEDPQPPRPVTCATLEYGDAVKGLSTAWVYGNLNVPRLTTGATSANKGGFGMLAIGRYQDKEPSDKTLVALPAEDKDVAWIHSLVYQKFGFDPRTAWNANSPLAARWGKSEEDEEDGGKDPIGNTRKSGTGYAGVSTRTREFTAYDEFLVSSFFYNNGAAVTISADESLKDAPYLAKFWYANTTNPQGPSETVETGGASGEGEGEKYYGRNSDNGADTDGDGVPDGWELYVMSGPMKGGKYVFGAPYYDDPYSNFGPFIGEAKSTSFTDNPAADGGAAGDNDKLTEFQEFEGTDSINWYAKPQNGREVPFSTSIAHDDADESWKWFNKFFPTDPWTADTDGDGIDDGYEIKNYKIKGTTAHFNCKNFLYGTAVDDNSVCIPGGGLNPCTIDTDGDGLPDLWEAQFAGTPKSIYAGDNANVYTNAAGEAGNPKQGLTDGMDGTVKDALSYPIVYKRFAGEQDLTSSNDTETVNVTIKFTIVGGVNQVVNRDYDHDGLENWQEYMTGMMRCWRYDDPLSRWDAIPEEVYLDENGAFSAAAAAEKLGLPDADAFWYETLVNTQGEFYNPHLVTGMNPANYMTRVTNGWDPRFSDTGTYYWLCGRIGEAEIKDLWCDAKKEKHLPQMVRSPFKYASCSPIDFDSDQDGLDDYYELFHGLNPLLGASGQLADSSVTDSENRKLGPCDLVYDAWYVDGAGALEAWADDPAGPTANYWQRKGETIPGKAPRSVVANGFDFEVFPWLNGLQQADPDGDDIRNTQEAIMPKASLTTTWHHSDPTPLWMTDSSYSNSLTRLFFRMQTRPADVPIEGESFVYNTTNYPFYRYDGYVRAGELQAYAPFAPDMWQLSAANRYNWMWSFEENEGYDSDHDGISDYEEAQGKTRSASDLLDADSPRRRQAMYFPGENAALQTPATEVERHPLGGSSYPTDPSFLTFTVEAWALPERFTDQVIVERAIWTGLSNPGDEEFLRKNFQLAIRNKKWYAKYDPDGTLADKAVEVYSQNDATGGWHHLAATYDGTKLLLYVDGVAQTPVLTTLQPEHGESVLALRSEYKDGGKPGDYWYSRDYAYAAIVVGASVKGRLELAGDAKDTGYLALDVAQAVGWDNYKEFFQGYVDEVRIWDGARSEKDIRADIDNRVRYTRDEALANRSSFYKAWASDQFRYAKDANGDDQSVVPELRYHWSFDSVFGAENATQVAKTPHGFDAAGKPILSRPEGYEIAWWKRVVEGYGSVYANAEHLDWVTWIPNTVAHLPRFDETTLDSVYWSGNYSGADAGTFKFQRSAEPVSRWTQMTYNAVDGADSALVYRTTGSRHRMVNVLADESAGVSTLYRQFEFTGRHLNQQGDDLLPLGGAFVKYVDEMWDDQGASSVWEQTGTDDNNDGLPDWWEKYADQNYRPDDLDPSVQITWDTEILYPDRESGVKMTAGEAYLRDLAKGVYADANGNVQAGPTKYAQTAKSDGLIPDWWKQLYKIDNEQPLVDTDNDGLNNYIEYLASEELPLGLALNPLMARTDTKTLDYFRKVGKLYLGEMLTDHDQMEDHWERSLADTTVADPTLWDALKDKDEDGWTNFDENRYNGYMMSNLAQLPSHMVGDMEVLDAPTPSVKLSVRYNGQHFKASTSTGAGQQGGQQQGAQAQQQVSALPNLIVRTFSDDTKAPDATFSLQPGTTVDKEVYVGSWEDRIVRGTMAPGNVDLGSVNIKFAQVPQSDLYSWTDESRLHLARPYAEFKEALEKTPGLIQNVQDFEWLELVAPVNEFTASDRAVTVQREALTQTGYIAVYGQRVGTIDLTTGDFEFNMGAMMTLSPNYTFRDTVAGAWSYKEAIFKLTYTATTPSAQATRFQVSLGKADKGFVRGGRNSIMAFFDLGGTAGEWDPGEPFGILKDVDIGWAGRTVEMEITDTSAVTPRIGLWTDTSDRENRWGASAAASNRVVVTKPAAGLTRVRVVRAAIDGQPVDKIGVEPRVILDRVFDNDGRTFLQEGDFLTDGEMDIDWTTLGGDLSNLDLQSYMVTNVSYRVVIGDGAMAYEQRAFGDEDTNTVITALATTIERRFETSRTAPTPALERCVFNRAQPTFAWTLVGEDAYAARFGTTYTAFKVVVKDGATKVYESPVTRMPAADTQGVYSWTAPLYVESPSPSNPGVVFKNLANYTWQVYVYNAKFRRDANPSVAETFRMNVTTKDTSSRQLAVGVSYAGPAKNLAGKVRVQAFTTPDFTGDPVAEKTVDTAEATVTLIGLSEGSYFLRAYIDTNGNNVHDDWESWGYLCERDRANAAGIFNPVPAEAKFTVNTEVVRTIFIEDCDTDGDWFPDVWEAEQNNGVFEAFKSGKGQGPVTGNAELIGVNTNLDANLTKAMQGPGQMMNALRSPAGVSLMTGVDPEDVTPTANGFEVKSEVNPDTLTIVGFAVDAAQNRVLLKVGAETTADVDPSVASFLNVTVRKGAEVAVKVEHAEAPNGPWNELDGVGGTVTIDRTGTDIEVRLNGELPAQGYFRAKIEEK